MVDPTEFETMPGSKAGHYFLVIAKKGTLKIGIRPIHHLSKSMQGMFFGFRLRAVGTDDAKAELKLPFDKKAEHQSLVAGVMFAKAPLVPNLVKQQWDQAKGTEWLTDQLMAKLTEAKADLVVTPDQIREYLQNGFDDALPDVAWGPITDLQQASLIFIQ